MVLEVIRHRAEQIQRVPEALFTLFSDIWGLGYNKSPNGITLALSGRSPAGSCHNLWTALIPIVVANWNKGFWLSIKGPGWETLPRARISAWPALYWCKTSCLAQVPCAGTSAAVLKIIAGPRSSDWICLWEPVVWQLIFRLPTSGLDDNNYCLNNHLLMLVGNTRKWSYRGCHVPRPQKMSRHRYFLNFEAPCYLFIEINRPLDLNPTAFSRVWATFHSTDADTKHVYLACAVANVRFYAALAIIARSISRSESPAMIDSVLSCMQRSSYMA